MKTKKSIKMSAFSRFFYEATSGEKKKVFIDIARKANKEQQKVLYNFNIK